MNILQIGTAGQKDHVYDFCLINKDSLTKVILVEPLPESLKQTREVYKDIPNCEFYELAIVDSDDSEITMYIPATSTDGTSSHASVFEDHLHKHLHPKTISLTTRASKINPLLDKFEGTIDRIYIDIEGMDEKVIRQIDFSKYDIRYLQYEAAHTDGPHNCGFKNHMLMQKLRSMGFELRRDGQYDIIAER